MKESGRFLFLGMLLVGLLVSPGAAWSEILPKPLVLIIHSYHVGFTWTDDQNAGIFEALGPERKLYEVPVEYLDWKRFPDPQLLNRNRSLLVEKYRHRQPLLILTTDDAALATALALRRVWNPSIPILFSGVTAETAQTLVAGEKQVSGVYESINIEDIVREILALKPHPPAFYLVSDNTETGNSFRAEVVRWFALHHPDFPLVNLNQLGFSRIKETLKKADPRSAALVLGYAQPTDLTSQSPEDWTEDLAQESAIPLFAAHDFYLGHGVVGGQMIRGRLHGEMLGTLAKGFLAEGKLRPAQSPLGDKEMIFDHSLMGKYGFKTEEIPGNPRWFNKPFSFVEAYPVPTALALGIITVLVVLVLVLLFHGMYRRRMSQILRRWNEVLERRVAERTRDLVAAQEALAHNERIAALSQMVMGISHKLNTPLGNLLTATTMMEAKLQDLEAAWSQGSDQSFEFLSAQLETMKLSVSCQTLVLRQIVDLVQRFRQVDVFRQRYLLSRFKMEEFIAHFQILVADKPLLKKLQIRWQLEFDTLVHSYEEVLLQVVHDLLENCALHSYPGDQGGPVEVRMNFRAHEAFILVEDWGAGISETQRERIFDPFFTTSINQSGGGLGLTICEALVREILLGALTLRKKEGPGCLFEVRIRSSWPEKVSA